MKKRPLELLVGLGDRYGIDWEVVGAGHPPQYRCTIEDTYGEEGALFPSGYHSTPEDAVRYAVEEFLKDFK